MRVRGPWWSTSGLCYCPGHVSGSIVHWIVQSTLKRSPLGVKIGCQSSIDLDYANDLALLTELLRIVAVPYSWFRCHDCRGLLAGPVGELAKTKIQCKFYTETISQFLIWFIS